MSILEVVKNTSGTKVSIKSDNFFPYFQRINKLNTEENRDLIFSELLKKKCIKDYYDLNYINDIFDYINLFWFERYVLDNLCNSQLGDSFHKYTDKYYNNDHNINVFEVSILEDTCNNFIEYHNEEDNKKDESYLSIKCGKDIFINNVSLNKYMKNIFRLCEKDVTKYYKHKRFFYIKYNCNVFDIKKLMKTNICFIKLYNESNICSNYNTFDDVLECNNEYRYNYENKSDNFKYIFIEEYQNEINQKGKNDFNDDYKYYYNDNIYKEYNDYNKNKDFIKSNEQNKHYNFLDMEEYLSNKEYYSTCKDNSCDISTDETDDNEIFYPALSDLESDEEYYIADQNINPSLDVVLINNNNNNNITKLLGECNSENINKSTNINKIDILQFINPLIFYLIVFRFCCYYFKIF
ncbi:putative protein, unknown function [Plasmodium gaboni]|uniref:Uncharacterized protein n=1 Tax=Plasmodium gaboni TaxID=647221 RepID=A0A151LLA4_9APIC|nr:putative protein, unknown function [Plasmodium gaboni]KYO00003.1 putative protein, unknown function [Plasmodium gaboni]